MNALAVAVILLHALGLLCSVHAVMINRSAQGAIAWGLSLNGLPALAVPLYLVFGRPQFEGYREAWQDRAKEVEALHERVRAALEPYEVSPEAKLGNYPALRRLVQMPLVGKNAATLLVDGQATFDSIIAGLARAKRYALVQFYIVHDDGLGRRLQAAMLECAARSVAVYFLYDEIGSKGLPKAYLAKFDAAGIEHSPFNSTRGRRNRFQLNFRNHRKSVVVDGLESWIGGHNVGDEYLGLDPKIGPWRDTHVHVVGPMAQLAQLTWLADWYWATRTAPAWSWEPHAAPNGADVKAMVVPLSPVNALEPAELFFVHTLNVAKERIWLATPYFVPDATIMAALRLAALRGVDVRIIIPKKSDNAVLDLATLWFIGQLDGLGIRFFRHLPGFAHQKVLLVDSAVSSVVSTILDNRSFRLQFEENVLFVDEPFAGEIERMLLADLDKSEPYDSAALRGASFARRLGVSLARLTAPLL